MCAYSCLLLVLANQAAPREVEVPRALDAVTSPLEPSGIVWYPPQARYLMVSDDTGLKEHHTYHAPVLFSATRLLAVDAAPVPIEGLEKLDDAESIALGPEGTLLVCTSHSPDRQGKSRPARRQLLWLAPGASGLAVKGRLDLLEVRDEKGRGLAELVSGRPGPVDIEGLEFRQGAVYLGFKAPLADDGAAAIVRLDGLLEAFAAGHVAPGSVEVFARPRMSVEGPDGQPVFEGVADLRFLPDGSLVVLANAPKGGRPDGGGAVWWLKDLHRPPALVRRFAGLKPEGVTLAADGASLAVVFDRGKEAPQWVPLPVPH